DWFLAISIIRGRLSFFNTLKVSIYTKYFTLPDRSRVPIQAPFFCALKIKKTSHRGEVASEVMERLSAVAFGRLSQFCLPDELLSCTKEMAKRHC
ncbi:hypothetical protein EFQ31_11760, partial [Limosilactobacillus fermentum]|nr:hypothetical protein [Limosilactobacillus fermentum]